MIVSTRRNHNRETQLSSSSRNISNLISVRRSSALASIIADKHLSLCLLNARSVKNKTADLLIIYATVRLTLLRSLRLG